VALQALFVAAVIAAGAFLVNNTLANLGRQHITTGFGFLDREAAFAIGESLIAYSPADNYARAFLVGLTNTLYVAGLGIVLATVLGTVMGLARLSSNWLIRKLAQIYVETFRNIPLALQLFFWWGLLRWSAPAPGRAWQPIADVFVSNRGVVFPVPRGDPAHPWIWGALLLGIVAAWAIGAGRACARPVPAGNSPAGGPDWR
jgi:general L-amino acid transport system permease protein